MKALPTIMGPARSASSAGTIEEISRARATKHCARKEARQTIGAWSQTILLQFSLPANLDAFRWVTLPCLLGIAWIFKKMRAFVHASLKREKPREKDIGTRSLQVSVSTAFSVAGAEYDPVKPALDPVMKANREQFQNKEYHANE